VLCHEPVESQTSIHVFEATFSGQDLVRGYDRHENRSAIKVLTQLGPDISETGVPEGHIKLVIAGEEYGFM
jgi:hypothetical protein